MATQTYVNKNFNGDFSVEITHRTTDGSQLLTPIVEDGVKWETEIQGSPGKLTFKIYINKNSQDNLEFQEGDTATLYYQDADKGKIAIFNGYIFTKKRSKDGWIDVTAYDQLRYFKNKATYVYTNKKASDVVKMLVNDYRLSIGTIEETPYVIAKACEDDQSLFDICLNATDETLVQTGKKYILYADPTGICLRNAENMKLNVVINDAVAKDLEYKSSIDEETYNEVELYYDNDETKKREYYNAADATNISKWGVLRYTESVQSTVNIEDRTRQMLKLYDRKTRELKVKEAFGDYRCRAGASVIVELDVGDLTISNYMLIEKATHTFKKNEYRMDLTLDGFNVTDASSNINYTTSGVVEVTKDTPKQENTSTQENNSNAQDTCQLVLNMTGDSQYAGKVTVSFNDKNNVRQHQIPTSNDIYYGFDCYKGSDIGIVIDTTNGHNFVVYNNGKWTKGMGINSNLYTYHIDITEPLKFTIHWVK